MPFCYCKALTEVKVPASVTSIGKNAFYNCTALTELTFECDNADAIKGFNSDFLYEDIFSGCTNLTKINVPEGCADSYKSSDGYKAALGDCNLLFTEWGSPSEFHIFLLSR